MKKPIILSGVAGSGKSYIAEAIKMQHDPTRVREVNFRNDDFYYGDDKDTSLIIYDEVPSKELLSLAEDLAVVCPKAQVVMLTQDKNVSAVDWNQMFYVINCSPKAHLEVPTKKDGLGKTHKLIEKLKYDYETCQVYVSTLVSSMEHTSGFDAHNHRTMIRENIDKMEELQEKIRSLQVEVGETASF